MITLDIATSLPRTHKFSSDLTCYCYYYEGPHCHHSIKIDNYHSSLENEAIAKVLIQFKYKLSNHSLKVLPTLFPLRSRLTSEEVEYLNSKDSTIQCPVRELGPR